MGNVLIRMTRMAGKRDLMKSGCNWLQDTSCMDIRSLIIKKLGFPMFPKRRAHSGERPHDGVDLQTVDEFGNSFLRKNFTPLFYPFLL